MKRQLVKTTIIALLMCSSLAANTEIAGPYTLETFQVRPTEIRTAAPMEVPGQNGRLNKEAAVFAHQAGREIVEQKVQLSFDLKPMNPKVQVASF